MAEAPRPKCHSKLLEEMAEAECKRLGIKDEMAAYHMCCRVLGTFQRKLPAHNDPRFEELREKAYGEVAANVASLAKKGLRDYTNPNATDSEEEDNGREAEVRMYLERLTSSARSEIRKQEFRPEIGKQVVKMLGAEWIASMRGGTEGMAKEFQELNDNMAALVAGFAEAAEKGCSI